MFTGTLTGEEIDTGHQVELFNRFYTVATVAPSGLRFHDDDGRVHALDPDGTYTVRIDF